MPGHIFHHKFHHIASYAQNPKESNTVSVQKLHTEKEIATDAP